MAMAASNFGLWLVFLLLICTNATFVQVNETCIDLSDIGLDTLCVTLRLDTCDTAFDILVTYDSDPIIDFSGDASDSQICNDAGSECTTCIKFDDDADHNRAFILEPTYAQLCPVISTECQVPPFGTFTDEEQLDCVILGIDCSPLNCGECVATAGCGWCNNSTTCMAQSLTSSEPYCETCSEELTDVCQSEDPTSLIEAQSFFEENRVAIIAGGIASAIFLVVGLIGIRWLKKKNGNHNYTQQRDDVELEQETSTMDLSAVQAVNGSSTSPQPVTSSGYVPPPVQ